MRRLFIVTALGLAAATAAAPAAAQYGGQGHGYHQGRDIGRQLQNLDFQIRRATDRGRISQREANRLLRRVDNIAERYAVYRRNGLAPWEHQDLQNRIQNVRGQLRIDRRDGGWNDRSWDDRRGDDRRWDERRWDDRRWDDRRDRVDDDDDDD